MINIEAVDDGEWLLDLLNDCADFTNPYGVRAVGVASSQASSDRLSQFGTARDYHDFDMQDDMRWDGDKDNDCDFMPPCLGSSDFYGEPSEDKYVMTIQKQGQCVNDLDLKHESDTYQSTPKSIHAGEMWSFHPMDNVKDEVEVKDYYDLDENSYHRDGIKNDKNNYLGHEVPSGDSQIQVLANLNGSSFQLKAIGNRPNECVLALDHETDMSCIYRDLKSASSLNDQTVEEGSCEGRKSNLEGEDDNKVNKDSYENDTAGEEGGSATGDELVYSTNEEDYEVFSLRIIHRKNRFENPDLLYIPCLDVIFKLFGTLYIT